MKVVVSFGALMATALIGCKSDAPSGPTNTDLDDTLGPCDWDKDNDVPEGATAVTLDMPLEGFVCPLSDQDWFSLSIPEGADLLKVDLQQAGPNASINPVYTVFATDGEAIVAAPNNTESAAVDAPLIVVHGLDAGEYFIRVMDQANDRMDKSHPYTLTVSALTDKDTHEPNNDAASAAATSGGDLTGYLSFRGDEDWYKIESTARGLLQVAMSTASGAAPSYRIVNAEGDIVVERKNDKGIASYDFYDSLADAGIYNIVVYFEDPLRFDTEVSYEMNLSIAPDPDTNEGNDTPDEATRLSDTPIACGATWSEWVTSTGYIASSGDIDWYKVDLTGTENGLIEVEVVFADQNAMPENMEPSVRLIYPVAGDTCFAHQECQELNTTCTVDIDCSKLGNTCLNSGYCAGSGSCMPGGNCGATLIAATSAVEVSSNPDASTTHPNRGTVRVAAPLFGETEMYIAVEDYQGNAQSATAQYTVRVRVTTETDTHEPSEVYMNRPASQDEDMSPYQVLATSVPVHDCTAADCCGVDTWIDGAISYTYDQDWYRYEHPCPDADCMVRIHYEVDGGEVDALMVVYVGGALWYDAIIPSVSDDGNQAAKSGVYGGLAETDKCFYAYRDHEGYYFGVRDTNNVSGGNGDNGTWDWNRDQHYRFCIEKIADTCLAPCINYEETGCGPVYEE